MAAEIGAASLAVAAINYYSATRSFGSIWELAYFVAAMTPLMVVGTVCYSLYYSHADQVAFGSLLLGAYATSFVVGLTIQVPCWINKSMPARESRSRPSP